MRDDGQYYTADFRPLSLCIFQHYPSSELRHNIRLIEYNLGMSNWVGKTLGNVRIDALLAHGGMGEVYFGMHTNLHRPVAVKILRNPNEENTDSLEDSSVRRAWLRNCATRTSSRYLILTPWITIPIWLWNTFMVHRYRNTCMPCMI